MYCKKCGRQMDDTAVFCPGCGAPTDNYVAPKAEKKEQVAKGKAWPLVFGILSIVFSLVILFQSCAVGVANALIEVEDTSGSFGVIVALLYLSGGIVLLATRTHPKKIAAPIIYGVAAFFALVGGFGLYEDLLVWCILSVIIVIVCLVSNLRKVVEEE